jgi:hypothetical protein
MKKPWWKLVLELVGLAIMAKVEKDDKKGA